ncbi:MAG: ATP-binding protein, partial [Caldimonas sp.]
AAAERGVELTLRLDLTSSEDVVLVDKVMLNEILIQLLDNAVRFTPSGRIRVNLELQRQSVLPYPAAILQITVSDTGIGIRPELHNLVFTPFYQVDDSKLRKVGGTGLGLAIVKRLCDVMRGSLALESAIGVGTTIRIRLPVNILKENRIRRGVSAPVADAEHASLRQSLKGNVLLVEDNEFNALLAKELLTLMGLTVACAVDGEAAACMAANLCFDAILMDCQMPNVDGYEATRRIRELERKMDWPGVPIIAITANALAGDRDECLAAGMDDYLAKPYTAAQLHAKLVRWIALLRMTSSPPTHAPRHPF